jgi:hypothetical protein
MSSLSVRDFVDPSKPWILVDGNVAFEGFTKFIPRHYRHGPWHVGPQLALGLLVYMLMLSAAWMKINTPNQANGWWSLFYIEDSQYQAFTPGWYITLANFLWMMFICWNIMFRSPMGKVAWITFTVWSWTIVTLRHGLLVIAPWVHSVRLVAEVLRFPGLMSATITTIVWNVVLFPAILLFYIKDSEQRRKWFAYFTNFRLTQLHVFNALFAYTNGACLGPLRPLHLGDLAAFMAMIHIYLLFYFCVLDRLGVHLYPIFSPRTPVSIPSMLMVVGTCIGGFNFWKSVLPSSEGS